MKKSIVTLAAVLTLLSLVTFAPSQANADLNDRDFYVFWGLGQNLSPLGNFRIGFGSNEIGLISGSSLGWAKVLRDSGPLFAELGIVRTSWGVGLLGGLGASWSFWSYFAFRAEVTATADTAGITTGYTSIGLEAGF